MATESAMPATRRLNEVAGNLLLLRVGATGQSRRGRDARDGGLEFSALSC